MCFRSRIRENSGRIFIAKCLNSHEFSYISRYSATSKPSSKYRLVLQARSTNARGKSPDNPFGQVLARTFEPVYGWHSSSLYRRQTTVMTTTGAASPFAPLRQSPLQSCKKQTYAGPNQVKFHLFYDSSERNQYQISMIWISPIGRPFESRYS